MMDPSVLLDPSLTDNPSLGRDLSLTMNPSVVMDSSLIINPCMMMDSSLTTDPSPVMDSSLTMDPSPVMDSSVTTTGSRSMIDGCVTKDGSSSAEMDAGIWENLPEHLLLKVLSRLPPRSFARFRAVCKNLNDLVKSQEFFKSYEDIPCWGPWVMLFHLGENSTEYFELVSNKLHPTSLASVPIRFNPLLAASDGGLLCSFTFEGVVVVQNPVTNASRELPPIEASHCNVHMLCMSTDRLTKSYEVFVGSRAQNEDGTHTFDLHVYDSRKRSWTSTRNMSLNIRVSRGINLLLMNRVPFKLRMQGSGVYSDRCVYFLCWNEEKSLLAYGLDDQLWRRIATPLHDRSLFQKLLQWRGRIFLVASQRSQNQSSIWLWELVTSRWEWAHVDTMPAELFQVFAFDSHATNHISISYAPCGDLLLLVSSKTWYTCPSRFALYDFEKKLWRVVQGYAPEEIKGRVISNYSRRAYALAYEPRVDAVA